MYLIYIFNFCYFCEYHYFVYYSTNAINDWKVAIFVPEQLINKIEIV